MMRFEPAGDTVTAKNETNLRDIPSQGEEATVLYRLKNGETAKRIGISSSGWSKLEYNGETVYAVSSYLTTDHSGDTPEKPEEGIQTVFRDKPLVVPFGQLLSSFSVGGSGNGEW